MLVIKKLVNWKKIVIDYDHDNSDTTQEFNKLTSENYRLKEENLLSKSDITNSVKKTKKNWMKWTIKTFTSNSNIL